MQYYISGHQWYQENHVGTGYFPHLFVSEALNSTLSLPPHPQLKKVFLLEHKPIGKELKLSNFQEYIATTQAPNLMGTGS